MAALAVMSSASDRKPQKAILRGAVGHHTLAKSPALKRRWGGMAPLLQLSGWSFLLSQSLVFCHFAPGGWSRELLTEI